MAVLAIGTDKSDETIPDPQAQACRRLRVGAGSKLDAGRRRLAERVDIGGQGDQGLAIVRPDPTNVEAQIERSLATPATLD